eukprot:gene7382-7591_t
MKDQITKLRLTIRKRLKQVQRLEEERAVLQEKLPRLQSEVDRATAVVQALHCCAQLHNPEQLQRVVLSDQRCEYDPLVPNDIVQMGLTAAATEQEADIQSQRTTRLINSLLSQPERVYKIRNMSLPERVAFIHTMTQRGLLLLSRYDCAAAAQVHMPQKLDSWPLNPKQEVDDIVDSALTHALVWQLLDQSHNRSMRSLVAGVNMETGQPEAYPPGWWDHTAEVRSLLDFWRPIKQRREALLAELHKAEDALQELRQKRKAELHSFQASLEASGEWFTHGLGSPEEEGGMMLT